MSNQAGAWSRPLFNCSLRGWQRLFTRYPEGINRCLRMRALVAGGLASAQEGMQERLFGAQLDSITLEDPLFIIGHWRSGTTLLHELMALDERLLSPPPGNASILSHSCSPAHRGGRVRSWCGRPETEPCRLTRLRRRNLPCSVWAVLRLTKLLFFPER